jgi:hypothetical protein
MEEREMDDRELRRTFHAAFDGARPRPDAPDRAFEVVAAAGNRARVVGRRLAGAAAIGLALLLVAVLQIQRGGLTPLRGASPAAPAATAPALPSPQSVPSPPTGTQPATGVAANTPYPEVVAAVNGRLAMAGWGRTGQVALTVDGGANWTPMRPVPGSGAAVLDAQWVDDEFAFVSTGGGLYRYQRSTSAWSRVSSRPDLVRLDFRDRFTGYAVTAAGDVLERAGDR